MSALYERSQLTQVMISSAPATAETMDKAEYLRLDCTIKEVQFTAGQKQDIDVTRRTSTVWGRRLRFPCRVIFI